MEKIIYKGKIWDGENFVEKSFYIKNKKIIYCEKPNKSKNSFIIPAFADAHIHGGWGFSFQKCEFEELEERILKTGVNFAIPTLMNDSLRNLERIAKSFRKYKEKKKKSIFPFLRVEGPFISEEKIGVQNSKFNIKVNEENIERFLSIDEIKLFTFSPEIPEIKNLINKALKKNKIPSIGHSNATFSDFIKIYEMGVRHVTHYPNALSGMHHRKVGLVGAGLIFEDLKLEVISDFVHTSPEFIQLIKKVKNNRFSIISDLIPPYHSDDKYFAEKNIKKNEGYIQTNKGILAGGNKTIAEQTKLLKKIGFSLEDIIKVACANNRKFFGYKNPVIKEGREASFLILDNNLDITDIFYKGEKIG